MAMIGHRLPHYFNITMPRFDKFLQAMQVDPKQIGMPLYGY